MKNHAEPSIARLVSTTQLLDYWHLSAAEQAQVLGLALAAVARWPAIGNGEPLERFNRS